MKNDKILKGVIVKKTVYPLGYSSVCNKNGVINWNSQVFPIVKIKLTMVVRTNDERKFLSRQ